MPERRPITSAGRLFLGGGRTAGLPEEASANIARATADLSLTISSLAFAAAGRRILAANEEIEITEDEQARQAFAASGQAQGLQETSLRLDADQLLRNLGRVPDEDLLALGKIGALEDFERQLDERLIGAEVEGLEPEHEQALRAQSAELRLKTLDAARQTIEGRFLDLAIADQMLSIDAVIGSVQRFHGPREIAVLLDGIEGEAQNIRAKINARSDDLFTNSEGREALINQKSGQLYKVAFDHALATEPLIFARWVMAGGLNDAPVLQILDAQGASGGFLSFQDVYTAKAKKAVRTQWETSFGTARLQAISAEKRFPSFEDNLIHRQDAYSDRQEELHRDDDLYQWAGQNEDVLNAVDDFLTNQIASADAQLAMFEAGGDIVLNGAGGGASPAGRQAVALFIEEEYIDGIRARFGKALVALSSEDEAVQLGARAILDEISEDIIDVIQKAKHVPAAIGQFQESIRQIGAGGRLMSASMLRHITVDGEGILSGGTPTSGARAEATGGLGPAAIADGELINSLLAEGLAPSQAVTVATEMQRKMAGNRNEALAALKDLTGKSGEATTYDEIIETAIKALKTENDPGAFTFEKDLPLEAVTAYKSLFDSQYLLTGSTVAATNGAKVLFNRSWAISQAGDRWRPRPPEREYVGLVDRVYADLEERWKLTAKAQNEEDLSKGRPPSMSESVPWDEIILDPIPTSEPGKMGYVLYHRSEAFGFKTIALVTRVAKGQFERPAEFRPDVDKAIEFKGGLKGFLGLGTPSPAEIKFFVRGIREGRTTVSIGAELNRLRKSNNQPLIALSGAEFDQLRRVAKTNAQGDEIIEALRVPRR